MTAFDQKSLETRVRAVLKDSPTIMADHTVAIVGVVDDAGARLVVATRLGKRWQIDGSVAHEWRGDTTGAVVVKGSW